MRFFVRMTTALFIVGVGLFCLLLIFGPRANLQSFPHSAHDQGQMQMELEPELDSNH